jgi:flavin reductase (DIM6/NTAB) family NADH-FMN oxidoreductase RutF
MGLFRKAESKVMKVTPKSVNKSSDGFVEVRLDEFDANIFQMISKKWMLITAGTMDSWNTMTANSGTIGELWHRSVIFTFIRPGQYTLEFTNREPLFTLCFFDEAYRTALEFCGEHSGRDFDKAKSTGLMPFETPGGSVAFRQAHTVIECRKMFVQQMSPVGFVNKIELAGCYPSHDDYHRLIIGETKRILRRGG